MASLPSFVPIVISDVASFEMSDGPLVKAMNECVTARLACLLDRDQFKSATLRSDFEQVLSDLFNKCPCALCV